MVASARTRTINILHLINNFGDSSISRIVERLVRQIGGNGFSWHVGALSTIGDMEADFRAAGAHVCDFSVQTGGSRRMTAGIAAYIRDHNIGLVHTHTPRAIFMAALARQRVRDPVHLATKHILQAPADRRFGLLYSLLDRSSLYLPDHLVAVSKLMCSTLRSCPGIRAQRVSVIQNAIDCDAFYLPHEREACRAELGLVDDSPLIGCAVRIEKVKRLDLLLEGFALVLQRHQRARLLIAGDGKIRSQLQEYAARLGIANAVIWSGFRKDIPRLLAAMDIYIQTSVNEGLSLSILEAMAAGKPVVFTDVGGAREVVTDGRNGVLIPPGSATAIGEALLGLLANRKQRLAIAGEARELVNRDFGIARMISAYRSTYEMLTSRESVGFRQP